MKRRTSLSIAIGVAIGAPAISMVPTAANAALLAGNTLAFDPGITLCSGGVGTPPDNCYYTSLVKEGSYFGMDTNGSGTILGAERTAITAHDGLIVGAIQVASGSHSTAPIGAPTYTGLFPQQTGTDGNKNPEFQTDGNGNQVLFNITEMPGVDEPWGFFGNTGMHYSNSNTDILSDDGAGNVTLDFSGWGVTWNGIPAINMGGDAHAGNPDGAAVMVCDNTCEGGDGFTLDYSATVPNGDPSGFGNVAYDLRMVGTVVPIPAAVWLFGSGLLGLASVARRKSKA